MHSRASSCSQNGGIDKLDFDSHRRGSGASSPNGLLRDDESFFEDIVDGVIERDRRKMRREVTRYLSFTVAILNCLCAGSVTAYSVYGHLFLSRLHYTQSQVNVISVAAELALYLFVPIIGYLCDRHSPGPIAVTSALLLGPGYLLAAFTYHRGPPAERGGKGWPFGVMVLAFVIVGIGTSCMYLASVTTCAKNFARGKHRGITLAIPIAALGLSGLWQSQVGSQLLYERRPDGAKGDVDVFRYFLFLAGTLFGAGLIGGMGLRVVGEEELIDEAVDDLEQSGLLEESAFFQRSVLHDANGYGTIASDRRLSAEQEENPRREAATSKAHAEEEERKKTWLLNGETRLFLADHTMWFLVAGFFLVTGPGEAFLNNFGTIIGSLYPPPSSAPSSNSAATHVSIFAFSSTFARLLAGALSDLLAPSSSSPTHYRPPTRSSSSTDSSFPSTAGKPPFTISRLTFLLTATLFFALAFFLLASPLLTSYPALFQLISTLAGTAYGAVFSLTPIVISVVWGVQNFGTNWGIVAVAPAGGAAVWSAVYSTVYMRGAGEEGLCWGRACYEASAWAWAGSCLVAAGLLGWAWRGRGGWVERGILV